jgi:hypothetical protein
MAKKTPGEPDKSTPDNEYMKLVIRLDNRLTPAEDGILQQIQKKFSKNGFHIEVTETGIVLWLRALEFEAFEGFVNGVLDDREDKTGEEPVNREIFSAMIERIAAIKSYSIRGGKRIYVTYNRERKVEGRKSKVIQRGLYYYARNNPFSQQNNEVPGAFENRIINEDSERVLGQLPDNCIDLIVTSPPYNFGLEYDTSADGVDWENYFQKLFAIFDECIRVLKFGGRIIVNVQPLFSDYIPSHHIISSHFMEKKMIWKGEILWEKNNYNCKYCAWGSWKARPAPI